MKGAEMCFLIFQTSILCDIDVYFTSITQSFIFTPRSLPWRTVLMSTFFIGKVDAMMENCSNWFFSLPNPFQLETGQAGCFAWLLCHSSLWSNLCFSYFLFLPIVLLVSLCDWTSLARSVPIRLFTARQILIYLEQY